MNWRKWLDECGLAAKGLIWAFRDKWFWIGFCPAFLLFGWLIHMLSNGVAKFQLLFSAPFPGNLTVIVDSFLEIFGVGQRFFDWLPTFAIATLQGLLIGLIVLLWRKKRTENAENLEKAGIITGLIALGAGCPTCGTTLITPLLGAIFSTGGLAVTGAVSAIVTIVAVVIAVLTLKRLGLENYVIIKNEEYLARKAKEKATVKKTPRQHRQKAKSVKKETK